MHVAFPIKSKEWRGCFVQSHSIRHKQRLDKNTPGSLAVWSSTGSSPDLGYCLIKEVGIARVDVDVLIGTKELL